MSNRVLMLAIGFSFAACAYGRANLIHRDMYGGVLALEGQQSEAMKDAQQQMMMHCGGPYHIVSEDAVSVGQTTGQAAESRPTYYGPGTQHQSQTTTTEVREYRLTYRCGNAPPPQGAPVATPQAGAPQPMPAQPTTPAPQPTPGTTPTQ